MKKLITVILSAVLLTGCNASTASSNEEVEPIVITNNTSIISTKTNLDGYKWVGEEIGDFQETTLKETIKMFDEKGSGAVFYGYVGCPWCERALPELNKVALKYGVTIYYVDASVSPTKEDYENLTNKLGDILDTDEETGEKELYVPFFVGFKDGEVVGSHTALVDDFEIEDDTSQMTNQQKEELQNIYIDILKKCAD